MTEWQRAIAFMRAIDEGCAEEIVAFHWGRALINRSLFTAPDLNYLLVDRDLGSATAAGLASESERIQAPTGIRFRRVNVDGQSDAERLLPGFAEMGFNAERFYVMVHHRAPDRLVDPADVRQVDWETYQQGRRQEVESWAPTRLIADHVLAKQRLTAAVVSTEYWCAFVDGRPASFCEVRKQGETAQIEFVETLAQVRGRGLARQVVSAALGSLRGSDFTFLVADLFGWPQRFYQRLGFDAVGIETRFMRTL